MRHIIPPRESVFLTAVLSLCFTACTGQQKTDAKTLVIGIESEVKNLDLRNTMDMNSGQVINLFTQSLVKVSPNMTAETDLALSYKVEGARKYSFNLPQDAKFHNGTALDCQDVLASFQQAAGEGSRIKSAFADVKEFSCPSSHTFTIELNNPKASFLVGDVSAVKVMPSELALSTEAADPIGSGPYKFVKRVNRDIHFERFEDFKRYRNGQPLESEYFFDKIIIRSVQDPTTRWLSLRSGDVDVLINSLSPQKVEEARQLETLQVFEKPGNSFQYLGFNLRLPKFQDLRVRKALAHAIDRDAIIKHKLSGMASPASSVLSPLNYYHRKDLPAYEYNPEKARTLLAEAGMPKIEIEMKISSDRDINSIMMVVKEQLEKVGAKVTLRPYEFATFFSDVQKGNFEMFSLRWVAVVEPDIMAKIFHSKEIPPGRNRVYFNNARLDNLVEQGALESDPAKRKVLYDEAQQIVAEQLPYIPMWYPNNVAVATSALKDYELSPIGTWASLLDARKGE